MQFLATTTPMTASQLNQFNAMAHGRKVNSRVGIVKSPLGCITLVGLLIVHSALCLAQPWQLGVRARVANLNESSHTSSQDGQATSLALRANWQEDWSDSISSDVQADWVGTGWRSQHSDGVRFNSQPRIPDVAGGDINQAVMHYRTGRYQLSLGRQTLEWDNLRFLSANNFWQNPQSFDSVNISYSLAEASHIQYAFINKALRIFGRQADANLYLSDNNYAVQNGQRPKDGLGEHNMHSHALQWQWREWDYSELTLYGYFINNETARQFSNDTLGARLGHQQKFSDWNYRFSIASARQRRAQSGDTFNLPYWHIHNSLGIGAFEWALDYEYLGSRNGAALITPLGFSHEYQGWADRFTATPAKGVEDISLRTTSRFKRVRLDLRHHRFYSIRDNNYYGRELDAELAYQFSVEKKIAIRTAQFWAADNHKNSLKSVRNIYVTGSYFY